MGVDGYLVDPFEVRQEIPTPIAAVDVVPSGHVPGHPTDLPPYNVPSPKVRIWDVERGPYGQETVHG